MSKEHYFIVKWSRATGWELDPESEEARFPDGTVWNGKEWELPYEGEGIFNDYNDLITQQLQIILSKANEKENANA